MDSPAGLFMCAAPGVTDLAVGDERKGYEEQAKDLKDRIFELRLLRDAQAPDGGLHLQFQTDIEVVTNELLKVERDGPRLQKLDEQIDRARAALEMARRASDGVEDPWAPAAIAGAVLGTVLLLFWLWLSTGPFIPVVGALSIAGGVGAFFASIQWRRDRQVQATAALGHLEELLARRRDG